MSYEDIEEARVKRTVKDSIKDKEKSGWKRKSTVPETDELKTEVEPDVAHAAEEVIMGKSKRDWKYKRAVQEADEPELESKREMAQNIEAPEPAPWRAPVARMY